MKFRVAFLSLAAMPFVTWSASPPADQDSRDLAVMVRFVDQHPTVRRSLRSIDFEAKAVYFAGDCIARFGLANASPRPGRTPSFDIEFKSSTCPVGDQRPESSKSK